MSKLIALSALMALAQARFGQENVPCPAIQALGAFGDPGVAGTLSGQCPGTLLGGANACAKLQLADDIVAQLGNDPEVIAAAIGLVAAEKNFNNFVDDVPTICDDATLPATPELQGIIPLVDPALDGAAVQNANSADSVQNPLAGGGSVADLSIAGGFTTFNTQDLAGAVAAAAGGAGGAAAGAGAGAANNNQNNQNNNAGAQAQQCNGAAQADEAENNNAQQQNNNQGNQNNNQGNQNNNQGNQNNNQGNQNNAGAGANDAEPDFGLCVPTIDQQAGRQGRQPDELTFAATDPLVAQGQQDALNFNIISNSVCDKLVNVCEANQAAIDACDAAQVAAQALDPKDAATADFFNSQLGF